MSDAISEIARALADPYGSTLSAEQWGRAYKLQLYKQIELAWAKIEKLKVENAFLTHAFHEKPEPQLKTLH